MQENEVMEGEAEARHSQEEGVTQDDSPSGQSEVVEQALDDRGESVGLESKGQNTEEKDSSASGPASVS